MFCCSVKHHFKGFFFADVYFIGYSREKTVILSVVCSIPVGPVNVRFVVPVCIVQKCHYPPQVTTVLATYKKGPVSRS